MTLQTFKNRSYEGLCDLDGVDGSGLEPPPSQGYHDRVLVLQDLRVPPEKYNDVRILLIILIN